MMDPMQHDPAKPDPANDDVNDLRGASYTPRRHAGSVVKAPDQSSFQDALKAVVDAGLNLRASDSVKRTLEINGPIDAATLDILVNKCGCTITPKHGPSPGDRVTMAIPEEGSGRGPIYTTMALGEETGGWPPGHMVTQAIPEEGVGRDDDSHQVTTQALGEEGQAHP